MSLRCHKTKSTSTHGLYVEGCCYRTNHSAVHRLNCLSWPTSHSNAMLAPFITLHLDSGVSTHRLPFPHSPYKVRGFGANRPTELRADHGSSDHACSRDGPNVYLDQLFQAFTAVLQGAMVIKETSVDFVSLPYARLGIVDPSLRSRSCLRRWQG